MKLGCLVPTECDSNLQIKYLSSIDRYTFIKVWLTSELIKRELNIFVSNRAELGSVNTLESGLRNVLLADVEDLVADIFTFLVTVKPKYHEIHLTRNRSKVICYWSTRLIELAYSWSVKKLSRVHTPVLEILREISIKYMTGDGGHLECGFVTLEKT